MCFLEKGIRILKIVLFYMALSNVCGEMEAANG